MTCLGRPPTSPDEFWATIDRCATAYGGTDWASLAVLGAATLVAIVAVVLLLGVLVVRLR